jgi:hypothetical protein
MMIGLGLLALIIIAVIVGVAVNLDNKDGQ